jgi:ketosteroid isomerase-like protein
VAKNTVVVVVGAVLVAVLANGCESVPSEGSSVAPPTLDEIVALERAALDRWITLDPQGYLDLFASEVSYFDPQREKRVDGLDAMKTLLGPIKRLKLPFTKPRYDMIGPHLQTYGDVTLLTFNLVSYGTFPGKGETVVARWNSTEAYARLQGKWRIVHSHWSYTKPELKATGS